MGIEAMEAPSTPGSFGIAPPSPSVATAAPAAASSSSSSVGQAVIPLVNKLQDIFATLQSTSTLDLPQVAVVGSQSSGKSSVLEALVGRDFLPRGSDICTRRPLVLQLVHLSRSDAPEWGEFLHLPNRPFTDFAAIRCEIQAETDREIGTNKGVSGKQIRLKIFSPKVLNITLVDLPGITKVPVGDQPSDIETRIRHMIESYIKTETCIILAVSPANADLANSDALQVARTYDPAGSRTIGVITKLDIMDRGTDARNNLLGNVVPLKLGYVGVVNRSQEDIVSNKTIQEALAYEEAFFRSRPVYHSLKDRCGVPQLAKKLNQILIDHIKTILPGLKARINAQLAETQKELASYGELTESKFEQGAMLLSIITRYSHAFGSVVDGKNEEMSTSELSGGARLHYIFQSIFVKTLDEVDPCGSLTDEDIRTAIQNATGPKNVLFVPEVPFEVLVRRQIARLLEPSLQCARFIYAELFKISQRCETEELQRFPVLRRNIEEVVASFLREGLAPAETMIGHLIEMEMDYINTSHPGFIGGSKAVELALQHERGTVLTAASLKAKDPADTIIDKSHKSRAILPRNPELSPEKPLAEGRSSWGIAWISKGEAKASSSKEQDTSSEPGRNPTIQLQEPPPVLKASDAQTEQEAIEIFVTRLLLRSYYDIVRKNIQDSVPKAIMHFLVNNAKRELHNIFIRKLYRESLFEEMLQEKEEVAVKRKECKEKLKALQAAAWTIEELPLEFEFAPSSRTPAAFADVTGLPPRANGGDCFMSPKSSKTRSSSGPLYPTIRT